MMKQRAVSSLTGYVKHISIFFFIEKTKHQEFVFKEGSISADRAFRSSNIHAAVKGGANYSTLSGAFVNADQKASQFPLRGKHNMPN